MTLAQAITYMEAHSGGNYRIEKNVRSEKQEYNKNQSYDATPDGKITLLELFEGISKTDPSYPRPSHSDNQTTAKKIDLLFNGTDREKLNAAKYLWHLKSKDTVPPLIRVLKDKSQHTTVRSETASALGEIGDNKAVSVLKKMLKDKSSVHVRENSAVALGKIGDKSADKALRKALKDKSYHVRREAAKALGKLKSIKAVNDLIKALIDKESSVRGYAAQALGEIGNKKATRRLKARLRRKEPNKYVRAEIVTAIAKIEGKNELGIIIWALLRDRAALVRKTAAVTLGKLKDPRSVTHLNSATKDSDAAVRYEVVYALGKIGDRKALSALRNLLSDPNPTVQNAAQLAIKKIINPQ